MLSPDLLEYCHTNLFDLYISQGQRIGQAWFNALPAEYRDKLVGSLYDPFFVSDYDAEAKILEAVLFLME